MTNMNISSVFLLNSEYSKIQRDLKTFYRDNDPVKYVLLFIVF